MPFDRIITLTLNPAIDLSLQIDTLRHEALNRVLSEQEEAGGKGINVSRLLTRLEVENTGVALCGEENLSHYQMLLGKDLPFLPVPCKGKIRENITLTTQDGTLIKLDRSGDFHDESVLPRLEESLLRALRGVTAPLLLVCGSLPRGLDPQAVLSVLHRLRETMPLSLAFDTLAFSSTELAACKPLFLKPNEYELQKLCGKQLGSFPTLGELIRLGKERLALLQTNTLLVSLGERGLLGIREKESWLIPGLKVQVRSTVAAGDSVTAGYTAALQQELPFPEALRLAAACGTAAVTKTGSGMGSKMEIESYFSQLEAVPV